VVDDLGVDLTPETEALHDELVLAPDAPSLAAVPSGGAERAERHLAGRQIELVRLNELFEQVVATGRADLVVVRGEPGIGKTALVSAFAAGCRGRATVLRGRCDELGRDLPLQPVADALAIALRGLDPDAAADLLGAEAGLLSGVLGTDHGRDAPTVPDAEAGRATLFAALLAVLERTGHGGPVLLVIDDLHAAGPSTLAWLTFAVRRGGLILLVACSRPGSDAPADAQGLDLAGLDETAAAALLPGFDPARVSELHRRTGGNPLLLVALADHPAGDLPASVHQAAEALAASLGPGVVATVRAAAVLGNDIDLDLLAEVLHRPALDVLTDLEAAHRAGLLDDRGTGLTFRHELVREALEATTTMPRRALVHRDAARALAARPVPDVLAVAVHARLGGEGALAVASYVSAASGAFARFDTDGALAHLDAAIALGGSAEAFALRARVRMATLGLEEAAEDAAEAVARGGGAPALEVSGWVAYYRRRYDEARVFADEGVVAAGDDVALRASCLAVAGRVRHARGDLAGAAERFSSVDGAPAPVQGVIDVWLGYTHEHGGEPAEALRILERPLVAPDQLAHPWAGLHGRFVRVKALGELGRLAEGLAACDDLALANTRAGAVGERFRGPALNIRSWVLRHAGLPRDADECSTAALELTSGPEGGPSSDAVSEFHYVALLDLADGRLLAGDVDGAGALLDRAAAVDTWQGTMAWHQRHRLGLSRARLALLAGDASTAAEESATVAADAAARGAGRYEALARAWLALAGGDGDLDRIQVTIDRLATTAALEGWRLVAGLGERFDVSDWRAEASARAGRLVAAAGPLAEPLRGVVAEVLA
jgi:hypothetical protein